MSKNTLRMITFFTSDPRITTAMCFTSSNFTSSNGLDFYSLLDFKYTEVFIVELPLAKLSRKIHFLRGVSSVKRHLFWNETVSETLTINLLYL